MSEFVPDFTKDNPIMQLVWAGFVQYAWKQEERHREYCESTGAIRPADPKNGMEALVDQATGVQAGYPEGFVKWVTENYWNGEPDDHTILAECEKGAP